MSARHHPRPAQDGPPPEDQDLTVILVARDWAVERWVVGTGARAEDWEVAGVSFWVLTEGRLSEPVRAAIRAAMTSRHPSIVTGHDPLSGLPVALTLTPTGSGLTIALQVLEPESPPRPGGGSDADADQPDGSSVVSAAPPADEEVAGGGTVSEGDSGDAPGGIAAEAGDVARDAENAADDADPVTSSSRSDVLADQQWALVLGAAMDRVRATTADEAAYSVVIEELSGIADGGRVSLGLISNERLLLVRYAGYGLIDLLRPLSDEGLGLALRVGTAVRVRPSDGVTWIDDRARVAVHAPFRQKAAGPFAGILTVEWRSEAAATPERIERIAAFADGLGVAFARRDLGEPAGPAAPADLLPPEATVGGPTAGTDGDAEGDGPGGSGPRDATGPDHRSAEPGATAATAASSRSGWNDPAADLLPSMERSRTQALLTRRWDPNSGRWPINGMSGRVAELSGFGVEELVRDPDLWASRVDAEDRSQSLRSQSLAPEIGERSQAVYRFQRRDGIWRLFQEDAVVFLDAMGSLINATMVIDITEEERTVDLLRESELRYRYLVDQLPGVVAYIREFDPVYGTLRTTYISPEIEALTGIPTEHWTRENIAITSMVHPEDLPRVEASSRAVIDRHADHTHEFRIVRPDGQIRWIRNRVRSISRPGPDGGSQGRWHGVAIDITAQRVAELALQDRETRFRLLVEQSPSTTLYTQQVSTATGQITTTYLSPQVESLTGYAPDDPLHPEPPFLALVHPDDLAIVRDHLPGETAAADGRATVTYRITHRNGETRWLRNMVERDAVSDDGDPVTWRGIVIDVTEQRVAEELARAQDARMRSIIEQASDIVLVSNRAGQFTFTSPAVETVLGYGPEDLASLTLEQIVHPDHLADLLHQMQRVHAEPGGRLDPRRIEVRHADGSWRWMEVSAINKLDQPEIAGVVTTARDVTEAVRAEQTLRLRESLLQNLVQHSADYIVVADGDQGVTYASPAALEFLGRDAGAEPGAFRLATGHYKPEGSEAFNQVARQLEGRPGGVARIELEMLRADGQWRWVAMTVTNHLATEGIAGFVINAHDITDQREAEQRLRDSEDRFRALFRFAPDIVMVLDPDGYVLFASPSVEQALGDAISRFIDRETQLSFHADDYAMAIERFDRALENPSEGVSFEARVQHHSGAWLWWEITVTNLLGHASVGGLVLNARDVTWRKVAEARLRESEERFRSLVQHGSDLTMLVTEDGTVSFVTPSSMRILGFDPDDIVGRTDFDWISRADRPRFDELLEQSRRRPEPTEPIVISFRHADGSWRALQLIATSLLDDVNVRGIVINAHDVTDRRTLEQQLKHQAYHDPLTGLPNRSLFNERLAEARVRAERDRTSYAVIFLDLDDFKIVNDTLGHIAGDQLLRTVADRLGAIARSDDMVARMGGDEFTILIEDLADIESAEAFADRVIRRLQEPVTINGHEVVVSPCLGIAVGRPDDQTHDLLREADVAMYEAKARGKGQRVVYDDAMTTHAWARMQVQSELRRALAHGQLQVHYQPQVELATGRITEFEALVRWEHPTRGLIAPQEFIPVAEETGLIVPLGQYVLEQACAAVRRWNHGRRERGLDDLAISVNLSARQFLNPALLDDITRVLRETGTEPGLLRLEITESVALNDFAATRQTLHALRALGVGLAIDDFGTGYSGLSYLRECPIDTIKIDRSYVRGLGADSSDTAMIHAVMAFATTLGLDVCAEGIEREEQIQLLRAVGCQRGQGFYFSGALPVETVTAMLESDPVWALGFWTMPGAESALGAGTP